MDLTIITPCYNSGEYLPDALKSVMQYKGNYSYEIIIIDDGSTDPQTLKVLNNYKNDEKIVVIHQENKGATAARNAGCEIARGKYLLFLDSDNKVLPDYIDQGVKIMNNDSSIAVVHGKPMFFGDNSREEFVAEPFDINKILVKNYIDMCTVVRKQAWLSVGGFDTELKRLQDWEFWIHLYTKGWGFHFINKIMFEYRIRKDSIGGTANTTKILESRQYVYHKFFPLIFEKYKTIYWENYANQNSLEYKIGKFFCYPLRAFQKLIYKIK